MTRGAKFMMVRDRMGDDVHQERGAQNNRYRYEGGMNERYESNRYEGGDNNRMGGYPPEDRTRDRRGREHYDNGRYAPRNEYEGARQTHEGAERHQTSNRGMESRYEDRDRSGEMRNEYRGEYNVESHYPLPNIIGFNTRSNSEESEHHSHKGGSHSGGKELTPEMAHEWVKGMHNEDGTMGEHWSMEQVKKLMSQKSIELDPAEVYAIINALYSDYCKVFKKHGMTSPELYLDLAVAFLCDKDAKPGKAMNYYEYIAR